jgi:hypothetical protein
MNKLTALLALATVGLGALSIHLVTELKGARKESTALQSRVDELERTRQQAAPAQGAVTPGPVWSVFPAPPPGPSPHEQQRGSAQSKPGDSSAAAPPQDMMAARRSMNDRQRKLMEDPEYRAAMRTQQTLMLAQQYPDLAVAMNLAPEQAQQLIELLADQQSRNMFERPPFGPDGAPDENAMREWQQQMQQRQRQNQDEVRQLLGDAGVEQWKEYQSTIGARQQVRQLRTLLDSSGLSLRQDQVQPLVNAIAAEQRAAADVRGYPNSFAGVASPGVAPRGQRGQMSTNDRLTMQEQSLQRTEQYNQRLHDAALPYLSSQQLKRFHDMLNTQVEMQRAQLRMMRAQAEAEARGEIPPAVANVQQVIAAPGATQFVAPSGAAVMLRSEQVPQPAAR